MGYAPYTLLFVLPLVLFKVYRLLKRPNFHRKTVWITGASSGIGEALVYQFASKGANVILTARDEAELNRVAANLGKHRSRAKVLPMDLSDPDAAFKQACEIANENNIDILVNNAGRSQRATFLSVVDTLAIEKQLMELNYLSVVALTKAVVPAMVARKAGVLVVLSSLSGLVGVPMRCGYSASKFAVTGYYESLRAEVTAHGLQVSIVYPGYVKTNISRNSVGADGKAFGKMDENIAGGLPVDEVARRIVFAVYNGEKDIVIAGVRDRLVLHLKAFTPWLFHWAMASYAKRQSRVMEMAKE